MYDKMNAGKSIIGYLTCVQSEMAL